MTVSFILNSCNPLARRVFVPPGELRSFYLLFVFWLPFCSFVYLLILFIFSIGFYLFLFLDTKVDLGSSQPEYMIILIQLFLY